jgi:hypothetical protein
VNRVLNARITRHLLIQWVRQNWPLALVGPLLVAAGVVLSLNYPVERRMVEGKYIRWTLDQASTTGRAEPRSIVYCDLTDGRTVMAIARPGWVPPHPGDVIAIEEQTMFWGGRRYRIP